MGEVAKTLTAHVTTVGIAGVGHLIDLVRHKTDRQPDDLPKDPAEVAELLLEYGRADPRWAQQVAAALAGRLAGGLAAVAPPPAPFFDRDEVRKHVPDKGVCLFSGLHGSGKTAMVRKLAEELAGVFPTDRCSVDLDQFRDGDVLRISEVKRHVLRQIGVADPSAVESDLDQQYLSAPLSRRILLVIDNVVSVAELATLAPGWSESLVLATTRNLTTDLRARYPVIALDGLEPEGAKALLASRCGEPMLAAEPEATEALLTWFGRLPFAIEQVSGLLSRRIGEKGAVATVLDEFRAAGISTTDSLIAHTLAGSVALLSTTALRDFRLLAVHPGPDFDLAAARELLGAGFRASINQLCDVGLVSKLGAGHYRLPWLAKNYALENAGNDGASAGGDAADAEAAFDRILDFYLADAISADFQRGRDRLRLCARPAEVRPWQHDDQSPIDWLDDHRETLGQLVEQACLRGRYVEVGQLCAALEHLMIARRRYDVCLTAFDFGARAARQLGEQALLARLYSLQGRAYTLLHIFDRAARSLGMASAVLAPLAGVDPQLESSILEFWGRYHEEQADYRLPGNYVPAIEAFDRCVAIDRQRPEYHRALGLHARMLANVLVKAGRAGDALRWLQDTDELRNESRVYLVRAKAHTGIGDLASAGRDIEAAKYYAAQDGASESYRYEMAEVEAEIAFRAGNIGAARSLWGWLVQEHLNAGHPKSVVYQAKLNRLPPPARR